MYNRLARCAGRSPARARCRSFPSLTHSYSKLGTEYAHRAYLSKRWARARRALVRLMPTALRMRSNINSGSFKKQLLERGCQCNTQRTFFNGLQMSTAKWWFSSLPLFLGSSLNLTMIVHTHERAHEHPTKTNDIQLASQETRLFCSYTRNSSQQFSFRIESLISLNRPRTISIPNLSSLAVSWTLHVSLLHGLIFV